MQRIQGVVDVDDTLLAPQQKTAFKVDRTKSALIGVTDQQIAEALQAVTSDPETEQLAEYAEAKRRHKGLDMIAANQVGPGLGFDTDDNALLVLWEGGRRELPRMPKSALATRLVELITERFYAQAPVEDPR